MTTNHTPGPWSVGDTNTLIYDADACEVAVATLNQERCAENARLIAAAPDLLAALHKILRAHESGNNGSVMGEATLCNAFALEARAAIAKARGE